MLLSASTFPNLRPMFGNFQIYGRKIKHLPAFPSNMLAPRQTPSARTAALDVMFLNMVRLGNLMQTAARMAGLSAIRFARIFPQTFGFPFHIRRRWFIAVPAVLGQLLFQLFYSFLQFKKGILQRKEKINNRFNTPLFIKPPQIFSGNFVHKMLLLLYSIPPENKLQYENEFV
jgi:hypothetical protein